MKQGFVAPIKGVKYKLVRSLVPYAKNARTHSDKQVDQIARSITEFGWTNPVLVKGNGIIAGHGRWLAAKKLGLETVPCIELAHLRKGGTAHWAGDRKQTTLWQIPKPAKSETGHSTQKPVECMRRPIENNSSPGHAVYEPFSGSGTTIIAAEMTGRSCLAIEIAPEYVDVAVLRWQAFTGGIAVLDGTKLTFADIAIQRKRKKAS